MPHTPRTQDAQRFELSKLHLLRYLSQHAESGLRRTDVERYGVRAEGWPGRLKGPYTSKWIEADLLNAGLIERRPNPAEPDAPRRYFITEAGRRYLEEARQQAEAMEPGQRQGWAARATGPDMEQAIAEVIRRLPEFRHSGDPRIEEVSRDLTDAIARSAVQGR